MLQFTHLALLLVGALLALSTNVVGLLMVSMVLQAGSVLNIVTPAAHVTGVSAYGVTVFHAMALVVVVVGLWRLFSSPRPSWPHHLNLPIGLLLLYVLVAVAGAWWLPQWFTGIQVHDLIRRYGAYELSSLAWNFGHSVQIISLLLLVNVMVAVWLICQTERAQRQLFSGLIIGCGLVLVIGGYEQIAPYYQLPSVAAYWANNPGYHQAPLAPLGFILNRIGLPFSEPSYASAYMAAMLMGTLAMALLGRRWWLWLPAAFLCAAGLINTLGSTGLVASGVAFVVLVVWVSVVALKPSATWSTRWRAALMCALLLVSSVWGFRALEGSAIEPHVQAMVKGLVVDKVTGQQASSPRRANDLRALELVKESYGLGVGMGSHRASSYFAALLANTGVAGFLLFMGMLSTLLWRYWKAPALSDRQIFVAAALPTATLAMGIGIPDLNMPMYWGFIILGFLFSPDDVQLKGAVASGGAPEQGAGQHPALGQRA